MCVCINEQASVPIQQQQLLYNGNEMRNSDKLSALGVKDDDLLMMMVSNASSGYNARLNLYSILNIFFLFNVELPTLGFCFICMCDLSSAAGNDLGMNPDGSASNPAAFQQHIRGDSNIMGQLFQVWLDPSYYNFSLRVIVTWHLLVSYLGFDVLNCRRILSLHKLSLEAI